MEKVYGELERTFPTYKQLSPIDVRDNGEAMVRLGEDYGVLVDASASKIDKSTGDYIFVRQSLAQRLREAQAVLDKLLSGAVLEVVYGYRSPEVQQKTFSEEYEKIRDQLGEGCMISEDDLKEQTHRFIAVPEVAGHPAGGAVDLRVVYKGEVLDMGSPLHDLGKKSYVFSPEINAEQHKNRQLLRTCMRDAGFAPFDGEWWHFSYGDREWAKHYGKTHAIFKQISFEVPPELHGKPIRSEIIKNELK